MCGLWFPQFLNPIFPSHTLFFFFASPLCNNRQRKYVYICQDPCNYIHKYTYICMHERQHIHKHTNNQYLYRYINISDKTNRNITFMKCIFDGSQLVSTLDHRQEEEFCEKDRRHF